MRKVCCGAQFSVVLAFDGHVYTFGQGICWIYLSPFRLFQFYLASFWSSIRASDWPAGFHAEEQIQPPGGAVPGGPVHRGHCCGLRTCASSVLHWRRLRLGLQQRGTGEPTSFLIQLRTCSRTSQPFYFTLVFVDPAWARTLQPSQGTNTGHSPAREERPADFSRSLPQLRMDRPFYLKELRYKPSSRARVHLNYP